MAPARSGFPLGFVAALAVTFILYAVTAAIVADSRSSDAAGNALSDTFAALFGGALWISLAVLLVLARVRGAMAAWAPLALLVLVPAAVVAFFVAMGRFGAGDKSALLVVYALPALLMLYATWARFPVLHMALKPAGTSAWLLSMVGVLTIAMILVGLRSNIPGPRAQEHRAAADAAEMARSAQSERTVQERDAAAFGALGPESHIADYLPYLHSRAFADQALTAIQKLKSRQADAAALLEQRPLGELADLWQFNLLATREVCEAYANAFLAVVNRITRAQADHLSTALDLEWQLPNLKWLVGAKCDLSGPLERAAANIKAVADSERLRSFAHTLSDMRGVK